MAWPEDRRRRSSRRIRRRISSCAPHCARALDRTPRSCAWPMRSRRRRPIRTKPAIPCLARPKSSLACRLRDVRSTRPCGGLCLQKVALDSSSRERERFRLQSFRARSLACERELRERGEHCRRLTVEAACRYRRSPSSRSRRESFLQRTSSTRSRRPDPADSLPRSRSESSPRHNPRARPSALSVRFFFDLQKQKLR